MSNDEIMDIVDIDDNVIGQAPRSEIQKNNQSYRLTGVLVYNSKGELLLQKRPMHKRFPGHYSCSAAGHVQAGEDYEQAALRELEEEMGIANVKLKLVTKETITYNGPFHYVAIFKTIHDGEFKIKEDEVMEGRFENIESIKSMIDNGVKFDPVFMQMVYPKIIQ